MSQLYKKIKSSADVFLPEQRKILCGCFNVSVVDVEIANDLEDRNHNTDVFVSTGVVKHRISIRVLSSKKIRWGLDQFTIRSRKPSGNKTELAKIFEGWGDYMLSCFGNAETGRIDHWKLLDLDVFRRTFDKRAFDAGLIKEHINTLDGTGFLGLSTKNFPSSFVISHSNFGV